MSWPAPRRRETLRVAALAFGLVLSGCTSPGPRLTTPPRPACAYAACGADASSLSKVTAANLQTTEDAVDLGEIQSQYNGAVLVWQAKVSGRSYVCREGRDPGGGAVHYVDCRRSKSAASRSTDLKAFP